MPQVPIEIEMVQTMLGEILIQNRLLGIENQKLKEEIKRLQDQQSVESE